MPDLLTFLRDWASLTLFAYALAVLCVEVTRWRREVGR